MSGSVSLSSLRAQVRKRADVEGETARHTDAEVNGYVNKAWNELYEFVASANEDYYSSQYSFNTAAGTSTYALPATFLRIRLATITSNGYQWELERINMSALPTYYNIAQSFTGAPGGYILLGDNVQIVPTPQGIYPIVLYYVARPTDMAIDADTIDCKAGWEEFIVWRACALVQSIDGRDNSVATRCYSEQKARIIEEAQKRNQHQPRNLIRRQGPRAPARGLRWGR